MHGLLSRSLSEVIPFLPSLAYAHGDDNVTAASLIGPAVAIIVFVTVVGLGKAFLRMIVKKRVSEP